MHNVSPLGRIVEALVLAQSFAFVIVVGPDEHLHLARWHLFQTLSSELSDFEVRPPLVLQEGLEITELVAGAATAQVVILTEPTQLCQAEREEQLTRLNLQRDALGDLPLRLVYSCTRRGVAELHRFAPDLVHWRSLLLVLAPTDLSVATLHGYLVWCLDTYDDERASASEQNIHLPRDPVLAELREDEKEISKMLRLSAWVNSKSRGVVTHSSLLTARHLVSPLVRHLASRALKDEGEPLPVVVEVTCLDDLVRGQLVTSELQQAPLSWWTWPGGAIVFVLSGSDAGVHTPEFNRLEELRAKVFVVGGAVPNNAWPRALVMMTLDPFADSREPLLIAARGLADLMESLFERGRLVRFVDDLFAVKGRIGTAPRVDEGSAMRLLHLDNGATWGPLSKVSERIAAALITTGRVDGAFFERLRALRPRARSEIERVEGLFRRISRS